MTLINPIIIINAVKVTTLEINHQQAPYELVNSVLQANQTSETLTPFQEKAAKDESGFKIVNNVLTCYGKLVVPEVGTLHTKLVNKIYSYLILAYLGKRKILVLVSK